MGYSLLSPLARQEDSSLVYHWPAYPGNPAENCWIDTVSGLAMVANNISDDNATLTPHGGLGWERTNGGNAMTFNAGTVSESIVQDWEAISISLWFKFHKTSGNNNRWLVNKFWDGSNRCFNLESNSSDKVFWNISTNSINNNGGPTSATGIAAAKWYYLTATWEAGTSNNAKLFLDGRLDAQTTRSGTTVRNNNEELRFAGSYNGGNAFAALGDIRIYRRALTESESRRLYLYPQRGKRLIVPGATVADGAISGSTSLTFSAAGTLAAKGALSGSSDLTFTPTGTLTDATAGRISGSTDLTFTASGTLAGKGALSGSADLTFSTSATLTGVGELAGSSSLTFTTAGNLTAAAEGAMSGSASLTFTPSGTLTGKGALSGSTDLTFTPSATISAKAAISGATTFTFTVSGTMRDANNLISVEGLQYTLTGDPLEYTVAGSPLEYTLEGN